MSMSMSASIHPGVGGVMALEAGGDLAKGGDDLRADGH